MLPQTKDKTYLQIGSHLSSTIRNIRSSRNIFDETGNLCRHVVIAGLDWTSLDWTGLA